MNEARNLPNSLPRPAGEKERLAAAWEPPKGWRLLSAVNNTQIGVFWIATAVPVGVRVDGFAGAFLGALTVTLVSLLAGWLLRG